MSAAIGVETPKPPGLPPQGLVDAYRETDFVITSSGCITLRVGQHVPGLDKWFAAHRRCNAVVITAFNPFSQSLPEEENLRRSAALLAAITAHGLTYAHALGQATVGEWSPEPSFCVFGPPPSLVDEWMRHFGQYAVVLADEAEGCRLLWHPAIRQQMAASDRT